MRGGLRRDATPQGLPSEIFKITVWTQTNIKCKNNCRIHVPKANSSLNTKQKKE